MMTSAESSRSLQGLLPHLLCFDLPAAGFAQPRQSVAPQQDRAGIAKVIAVAGLARDLRHDRGAECFPAGFREGAGGLGFIPVGRPAECGDDGAREIRIRADRLIRLGGRLDRGRASEQPDDRSHGLPGVCDE